MYSTEHNQDAQADYTSTAVHEDSLECTVWQPEGLLRTLQRAQMAFSSAYCITAKLKALQSEPWRRSLAGMHMAL